MQEYSHCLPLRSHCQRIRRQGQINHTAPSSSHCIIVQVILPSTCGGKVCELSCIDAQARGMHGQGPGMGTSFAPNVRNPAQTPSNHPAFSYGISTTPGRASSVPPAPASKLVQSTSAPSQSRHELHAHNWPMRPFVSHSDENVRRPELSDWIPGFTGSETAAQATLPTPWIQPSLQLNSSRQSFPEFQAAFGSNNDLIVPGIGRNSFTHLPPPTLQVLGTAPASRPCAVPVQPAVVSDTALRVMQAFHSNQPSLPVWWLQAAEQGAAQPAAKHATPTAAHDAYTASKPSWLTGSLLDATQTPVMSQFNDALLRSTSTGRPHDTTQVGLSRCTGFTCRPPQPDGVPMTIPGPNIIPFALENSATVPEDSWRFSLEQRPQVAVKRDVNSLKRDRLHKSMDRSTQPRLDSPSNSPSKEAFGSPFAVAVQPAADVHAKPTALGTVPLRGARIHY